MKSSSYQTGCDVFGLQKVIEQKIQEAQAKGDFDDLPGMGKPVEIEDDRHVPEDLRLAYKILKNANCVPPEVSLRKEIKQMEDMLVSIQDEKERYRHIKKMNFLITRLNLMRRASPLLEDTEIYYKKVVDQLGGKRD